VIGGDLDIVTKLEASRTIAAAVPAGRLQVVAGVNHMGFLERADEYNQAILEFASGLRGGTTTPQPDPCGTAS
jgi:pimeloyl-ACP methyl ester carboxylesterase